MAIIELAVRLFVRLRTLLRSSFSYGLDSDSRRTSCTEASGAVVSWRYDWGGRLTSESRTGSDAYSTTYTVDGEGRRTSQGITVGGSTATTSFTLNSDDELTATSISTGGFTNSYSYNDNGEQTGRTLAGTARAEINSSQSVAADGVRGQRAL